MKVQLDIGSMVATRNSATLGNILCAFMRDHGGHPFDGWAGGDDEWTVVEATPRNLMVILMGDAIYDEDLRFTHVRHGPSGLEALWFADGTFTLMFHHQGDAEHPGFTILNPRGGTGGHWRLMSPDDARDDPRSDPAFRPEWLDD